jgi:hypothetical protein
MRINKFFYLAVHFRQRENASVDRPVERTTLAAYGCGNTTSLHDAGLKMALHTKSTAHSGHPIECTSPHPRHHAHPYAGKSIHAPSREERNETANGERRGNRVEHKEARTPYPCRLPPSFRT